MAPLNKGFIVTTKLLRRSTRLTGLIATMALTAGLTAAPASADPGPSYIGLGDSYAAGIGGGQYSVAPGLVPEPCAQTGAAYSTYIGGLNLACAGATTTDVSNNAIAAAHLLKHSTHVTVTAGANDIEAAAAAAKCAALVLSPACKAALFNSLALKLPKLPAKIKSMVAVIKSKAPRAKIVITGYPRLFTVNSFMTMSQKSAATTVNAAVDLLNATIAVSAVASRVGYLSVTQRFINHGLGSADPWIVGVPPFCIPATCASAKQPGDVFHPTAAGHRDGYALTIRTALTR
jgi:lysophospholipase L1-like esterase